MRGLRAGALLALLALALVLGGCLGADGDPSGADDGRAPASADGGIPSSSATDAPEPSSPTALNGSRPGVVPIDYHASYDSTREGDAVAGTYASDYDRDGAAEVLLTGSGTPTLYDLDGGEPTVVRRFERPAWAGGALFLDHDNDGWDDLLLLNHQADDTGRSAFYANRNGSFVREEVGLERRFPAPRGATAADSDGDGCLEVLVYQAGDWRERRPAGYGARVPIADDNGRRNLLFDGDCGSFAPAEGSLPARTWTLAASFVDLTGDGRPDVHVANDFNRDLLYVNRGDGRLERRVLGPTTDRNGMSSEVADVTGDGRPDVFVSNIYVEDAETEALIAERLGERIAGNNLLVNQGNASFVDAAERYGVRRGGWGWAASVADLENDGERDLVQATTGLSGRRRLTRNRYWRGTGDGFRAAARPGVTVPVKSLGLASLDADGDGSVDLVVSNLGRTADVTEDPYYLYDNPVGDGNWIRVDVASDGTTALGSRVRVTTASGTATRFVHASSDYMAQDARTVHVGLGDATSADVRVTLPDGRERRFDDVPANTMVRLST